MGRPPGYEYSYDFLIDDEIIHLYPHLLYDEQGFVFEIRTTFKLKTRVHDEIIMGSERFAEFIFKSEDLRERSLYSPSFRLQDDYWMSGDEYSALLDAAMDFARQRAAEDPLRPMIPVAVGLAVWTVQQEGESINDAVDRAMKPERLIPTDVWPMVPVKMVQLSLTPCLGYKRYLRELPRIRVEDEARLGLMETCPVCWRAPIIGDQVFFLPDCVGACHPHCFFKWLKEGGNTCPSPSCAYIPKWDYRTDPETQDRLKQQCRDRLTQLNSTHSQRDEVNYLRIRNNR